MLGKRCREGGGGGSSEAPGLRHEVAHPFKARRVAVLFRKDTARTGGALAAAASDCKVLVAASEWH